MRLWKETLTVMEDPTAATRQPKAKHAEHSSSEHPFFEYHLAGMHESGMWAGQFEIILNDIADGITVLDRDGNLTYANDAAARLLGYPSVQALLEAPPQDVMRQFEILDESGRPFPTDRLPSRRALRGELESEAIVRYRVMGSGEERWSSVTARAKVDDQGEIRFVVTIIRDITERKRNERALRFLAEAGMILAPSLDYTATLQDLARLIVPFLADASLIDVLEGNSVRRMGTAHADPARQALIDELRAYPPNEDKPHPVFAALREGQSELGANLPDSLLVSISHDDRHLAIMRELHPQSYMVVPLLARGRILGTITFWITDSPRRYGPEDLALAEELANRAALAIDNARLFQSEREARAVADQARLQTTQLQAVTAGLAEALTSRQVADVMTAEGVKVLGAEAGWVALVSATGTKLNIINPPGTPWKEREPCGYIPIEASVPLAKATRMCKPLLLRSRDDLKRFPALDDLLDWGTDRALAILPLMAEGRILGVLGLDFPASREFTNDDRGLMSTLAQECAQALERARLYEAERGARALTEAHGQRLVFLAEASRILASSLNYEHTFTRLAQLSVPELADWCAIHVIADDESIRRLSVAHVDENKAQWARELLERYPFDPDSPSGLAHVLRTGKPELFADIPDAMLVESAHNAEHLEMLRTVEFTSAMIVPLRARGRTLGAMTFVTAESRRHYGLADLEFVQDLARRTAISMDNARLYHEAQCAILAREEFLSIASHELKTPLTTVKSYAQMLSARLRKPNSDPKRVQHLTNRLEDQILRLETLVIDLLDASRIQQGRLEISPESVDLVPLTREVMSRFEDAPERLPEHSLVLDAPEPVVGNWDPARLDQVLTNLVSNALKYSPQGGEIRVRLRQHAHDAEIAVSDQGIGIPREEQTHLFEPFTRATRSGEVASGQGLGLFITAQIVQAHEGTIEIESQPGSGSTFSIHLPC